MLARSASRAGEGGRAPAPPRPARARALGPLPGVLEPAGAPATAATTSAICASLGLGGRPSAPPPRGAGRGDIRGSAAISGSVTLCSRRSEPAGLPVTPRRRCSRAGRPRSGTPCPAPRRSGAAPRAPPAAARARRLRRRRRAATPSWPGSAGRTRSSENASGSCASSWRISPTVISLVTRLSTRSGSRSSSRTSSITAREYR